MTPLPFKDAGRLSQVLQPDYDTKAGHMLRAKRVLSFMASCFRALVLFTACLTLVSNFGCSGGSAGLDGGGIPIGGSRLAGVVVGSENYGVSISGATVTIQTVPVPGSGVSAKTAKVISAVDGSFLFPSVPAYSQSTNVLLTITPPAASHRQIQQFSFSLIIDQESQLIVSLPDNAFDASRVYSVGIASTLVQAHPGYPLMLEGQLFDKSGGQFTLMPSLLVTGNIGTLQASGTLQTTPGVAADALVTALWFTGKQQLTSNHGLISLNNSYPVPGQPSTQPTGSGPPPPPTPVPTLSSRAASKHSP